MHDESNDLQSKPSCLEIRRSVKIQIQIQIYSNQFHVEKYYTETPSLSLPTSQLNKHKHVY